MGLNGQHQFDNFKHLNSFPARLHAARVRGPPGPAEPQRRPARLAARHQPRQRHPARQLHHAQVSLLDGDHQVWHPVPEPDPAHPRGLCPVARAVKG